MKILNKIFLYKILKEYNETKEEAEATTKSNEKIDMKEEGKILSPQFSCRIIITFVIIPKCLFSSFLHHLSLSPKVISCHTYTHLIGLIVCENHKNYHSVISKIYDDTSGCVNSIGMLVYKEKKREINVLFDHEIFLWKDEKKVRKIN